MCPLLIIVLLLMNNHQVSSSNQEDVSLDTFLPDAPLLVQQFYQTLEAGINHLVVSRDMHRAVRRHKRQTIIGDPDISSLGAGAASAALGSGGGGGGFGSLFQGDPLGGVNSLIGLGSLNGLNNVPDALGPVAPILQGIGTAHNVVKQITNLDRMKCANRLACEYMANRGLFNRTSALLPSGLAPLLPNNTRNAFNLSNPSTFRTVLGVLQLMGVHQFAAYPHLEAGLWGVAHRDHTRCRTQFEKCPSTSEAFVNELNNTPGGVQGMLTQAVETLRPVLPGGGTGPLSGLLGGGGGGLETAASTADLAGLAAGGGGQAGAGGLGGLFGGAGNLFGQGAGQLAGLGNLAGLGGLGGAGAGGTAPNRVQASALAGGQQGGGGGNSGNTFQFGGHQFTAAQLTAAGIDPNLLTQYAGQLGNGAGAGQFAGQGAGQFGAAGLGAGQFGAAGLGAGQFGGAGQQFLGAGLGGGQQFGGAGLGAGQQFGGAGQQFQFSPAQLAAAGIGGGQQQFGAASNQFTSAQLAGLGAGGGQFGSAGLGQVGGAGHQFTAAQLAAAGIPANQFDGAAQFGGQQFGGQQFAGQQFAGQQFAGQQSFGGGQFSQAQLSGFGGDQFSAGLAGSNQFAGQGFGQQSAGGFGGLSNFLKTGLQAAVNNKKSESYKPKWSWG